MNKKGFSTISTTLVTVLSLILLITTAVLLINMMTPFLTYQKIQMIAMKYMFVIEKYGYLTQEEKEILLNDIEQAGLKKEHVSITYPEKKLNYGELLLLEIKYNDTTNSSKPQQNFVVRKYSYVKI